MPDYEPMPDCILCGVTVEDREHLPADLCNDCEQKLPSTLVAATTKTGEFRLTLRNGYLLKFSHATLTGPGWAYLRLTGPMAETLLYVDVHIPDILWCGEVTEPGK